MLSSKIFQNLTLPEDAKEYLENLDDYDDPYFMCVKVLKENDQMMKVVNDTYRGPQKLDSMLSS